jgi:hypothetical protein
VQSKNTFGTTKTEHQEHENLKSSDSLVLAAFAQQSSLISASPPIWRLCHGLISRTNSTYNTYDEVPCQAILRIEQSKKIWKNAHHKINSMS